MTRGILHQAVVGLAGLGLLFPTATVRAADSPRSVPPAAGVEAHLVTDIALGTGGTLYGQVVNSAGQGMPGVGVHVRSQDAVVANTMSGDEGKFVIGGLRGGVVHVSTENGVGIYRLWASETAPPAAGRSALIVNDAVVVRGQAALGRLLANPLIIAGVIAAAVAIPVAVHEYREDHKSGS